MEDNPRDIRKDDKPGGGAQRQDPPKYPGQRQAPLTYSSCRTQSKDGCGANQKMGTVPHLRRIVRVSLAAMYLRANG